MFRIFNHALNGEVSTEAVVFEIYITDNEIEISSPVCLVYKQLKNNRAFCADDISAELFETGGQELIKPVHQLLLKM